MALSDVQSLITSASSRAQEALDTAIDLAEAVQTYASGALTSLGPVPSPTEPDIEVPAFITATEDLGGAYLSHRDTVLGNLQGALGSELATYMAAYFPDLATLGGTLTDWLTDAIAGGTTIDPAVENALFQRARDRLSVEQMVEEETIVDGWVGRGWNTVSPVTLNALAKSRQGLINRLGDVNRDILIKQHDAELDMLKFAVDQLKSYYLEALKLRNELMDLFRRAYEEARQSGTSYVDAKRKLWEGVSAYYRALIDAAGLTLEYDKIRIESANRQNDQFVEAYIAQLQARWQGAVGAAEAAGKVAAAYGGAQNALAEISHQTTATE